MKKFIVLTILIIAQFALGNERAELYKNLEGLEKIGETIDVRINFRGDEPFDVESSEIRDYIKSYLQQNGIKLESTGSAGARIRCSISGETTGGGGAEYQVIVSVYARVESPFIKQKKIDGILWQGNKAEKQLMSYDKEAKMVIKPRGKISQRVKITLQEILSNLVSDMKKANVK